ncbi:MAG: prepilin-type N-terminal cleavage/methylation domain-containing protein [Pseudobdellovibrionaceae bacterium]|nr:prepilin-type N-terminal cleavage/methylation domain-containing protein [Pseudobdellovibrionaceae bacterium]
MLKVQTNNQHNSNAAGFSLIEVAIGLMIIGILMVPALQMYKEYRYKEIRTRSEENLGVVANALKKFVVKNGRYPRPAESSIAGGATGEGAEIAVGSITFPCSTNMTTVCETTGTPANRAYIGTIPFAALGLPKQYTIDGYGNRFTYAVTKDLTVSGSFSDSGGKIQVIDQAGGNKQGTSSNVHYVLVSHGKNGKGTTTNAGVLFANCAGAGKDLENCDNDGVFNSNFATINTGAAQIYARYTSDVPGADYFDDYIYLSTTTSSDIWTPNPNAGTPDLYNRNAGNIRIGSWPTGGSLPLHDQILPVARLDIAGKSGSPGNLKADQVNVNRLCAFSDTGSYTGCISMSGSGLPKKGNFAPIIIGGDADPADGLPETSGNGIFCGAKGLYGIYQADELCRNAIPTGSIPVDGTCANSGWAARKVVSGVIICEPAS